LKAGEKLHFKIREHETSIKSLSKDAVQQSNKIAELQTEKDTFRDETKELDL
jgi:uncharacterized coiled-coil DUF342 family protein